MTSKEMTLTISLGRETYVTPNAVNLVRVLTDDQLSELIARWAEELPDTASTYFSLSSMKYNPDL